jgi:hypothetical protein
VITFVIFASGLKYVGLQTSTLGWVLLATIPLAAVAFTVMGRRVTRTADAPPEELGAGRFDMSEPVLVRNTS